VSTGRQSLGDQLKEVRRTRFGNIPRVRPVMQMLLPSGGGSEAARRNARQAVLEWAAEKWQGLVPAAAFSGEDFEHERPGLKLAAVGLPESGVWGFFVEHLDLDSAHARTWVTEAVVAELDQVDLYAVRNQCSSTSTEDVPSTTPRFVRQWLERHDLRDAGRTVRGSAATVSDPEALSQLLRSLLDPSRQLPIVVASQLAHESAAYSIDCDRLAQRTAGLAHVFCLPMEQSFALTEILGKELAVFNGAVRTYWPGLGTPDDTQAHINVLAPRIKAWQTDGEDGPTRFLEFLTAQLHRFSVNTPAKLDQHPGFAQLRRKKADIALATRVAEIESRRRMLDEHKSKSHTEDLELLRLGMEVLEGELAKVRRELASERTRADYAEQVLEIADEDSRASQNELESMRAQNAHLFGALKGKKGGGALAIPSSYEVLPAWLDEHFADRILLLGRAKRALKGAMFEEVELVFKGIKMLGEEYWDLRTAAPDDYEKAKKAFESKLQALGITEGASITASRVGEVEEQYTVEYTIGQSSRQKLDRHLRGGSNTKDDRYCMRVYFFWDDARQKVVIGHLPSHLDTRTS